MGVLLDIPDFLRSEVTEPEAQPLDHRTEQNGDADESISIAPESTQVWFMWVRR